MKIGASSGYPESLHSRRIRSLIFSHSEGRLFFLHIRRADQEGPIFDFPSQCPGVSSRKLEGVLVLGSTLFIAPPTTRIQTSFWEFGGVPAYLLIYLVYDR